MRIQVINDLLEEFYLDDFSTIETDGYSVFLVANHIWGEDSWHEYIIWSMTGEQIQYVLNPNFLELGGQ